MEKEQRSFGKVIQDIITSLLAALFIAVMLRVFFIGVFLVPSSSMEKKIIPGDHVFAWKFLYNKTIPVLNKPFFIGIPVKRKDIIVFKRKGEDDDYIKRVIGLPGEKILLKDYRIFINGVLLKEPYINKRNVSYINSVYEVPEGKLFVLGDNRNNSRDSRTFGFIYMSDIIGKVFFTFYPFTRMGFF